MKKTSLSHQIRLEQIIITVVCLAIFLQLSKMIFHIDFASDANYFVLLLFTNFIVILLLAATILFSFYLKKDTKLENLRSGLHIILILGSAGLFFTVYGYFVELHEAAVEGMYSGLFGVITAVVADNNNIFFNGIERVMKSTSMAMVGVYISIVTALLWFVLSNKINRYEYKSTEFEN